MGEILDVSISSIVVSKKVRFINCFIDLVAIYVFSVLLGELFGLLGTPALSTWTVLALKVIVLKGFYYFFMEAFTGRTIGKIITNTMVVNMNETKPTLSAIFVRTLYRLLPFESFSYLRKDAAGWHDSFSNTKVIKNNHKTNNKL